VTSGGGRQAGYSLIELLVATLLVAIVGLMVLSVVSHGFRVARARPEAGDLHQRLRVAVETMRADLRLAGAGLVHGDSAGPLVQYLAPIVPARTGALSPDPDLSAFGDRITILYVPEGGWRAPLAADMADPAGAVPVDAAASTCPSSGLCGFLEGSRAILIDRSGLGGGHDIFTVTGIAGVLARGAPNPLLSRPYSAAGTLLLPVVQRVYYLDRAHRRLMLYDGYLSDLPLVDNVADLSFTYYGSPSAMDVPWPADGAGSCVFSAAPSDALLMDHDGSAPRVIGLAELQDGPVCGAGPGRFDGDLLRIRQVRIRLRVEAAADDLRAGGPAFARAGTSSGGESAIPDYEVSFDVSPQNLWPIR
jgi:prepilin-type N-terminal cleavage/methylation domain-containing protein